MFVSRSILHSLTLTAAKNCRDTDEPLSRIVVKINISSPRILLVENDHAAADKLRAALATASGSTLAYIAPGENRRALRGVEFLARHLENPKGKALLTSEPFLMPLVCPERLASIGHAKPFSARANRLSRSFTYRKAASNSLS
jgi:hypothetical protein